MRADPAVRAGWFDVTIIPWMVPHGVIEFTSAKLPACKSAGSLVRICNIRPANFAQAPQETTQVAPRRPGAQGPWR